MSRQIKLHRKASKHKGYTLVELMVAMVIGLILTAGILQLFVSNKQTYRVTENMSRLQENGRFAMFFLTKDIRMADFWGCRSQELNIQNNLDPAGGNYDSNLHLFTNTVDGTDGVTDTITLRGAMDNAVSVTTPFMNTASAVLKVNSSNGLEQGDIILVSDCAKGDIVQISNNNPSSSGNIVHNTGNATQPGNFNPSSCSGGNAHCLSKQYDDKASVFKLGVKEYSIQNTGPSGENALFRNINGAGAQELVEGIENMQILYGEDTDGDGAANYYKASGSVDMDKVVSVRVSLVAVTLENNMTERANAYDIFGVTIDPFLTDPTDKHIRRVFTSTIVIRNRLP